MITGMPRIAIAVRDIDKAIATFRDALGMPVIDISATSVTGLGARLAMCVPVGGSNIELMSPAAPGEPLSESLSRFLDRRGEGLFALMLEAPDPDAEADALARRGLNVLPLMRGAGGRDVHPNSTHGVLVRVYPTNSFRGEDHEVTKLGSPHPLSGVIRVLVAVRDFDHALRVYRDQFALAADDPVLDGDRGVRAACCHPGTGGVIEIVSPESQERPFARSLARRLAQRGEGMHALVLQAADPAAAAASLRDHGLEVQPSADSPDVIEVQPASTFGALLRIEKST